LVPISILVTVACSPSVTPFLRALLRFCRFQSFTRSKARRGLSNLLLLSRIFLVSELVDVHHTFRPPLNSVSASNSFDPKGNSAYLAYGFGLTGAGVAGAGLAGVIARVFLHLPSVDLSVVAFLFDCVFFLCARPAIVIDLSIRLEVRSVVTSVQSPLQVRNTNCHTTRENIPAPMRPTSRRCHIVFTTKSETSTVKQVHIIFPLPGRQNYLP